MSVSLPSLAPAGRQDAPLQAVFSHGGPYSLRSTIGVLQCGPHDPAFQWHDDVAWLAFRTTAGAVTLRLQQVGRLATGEVKAHAWGPGAAVALESVPTLLGFHDDWTEFDAPEFHATLPDLALKGRYLHPGLRLPATGRMLDTVARIILEQKVTGIEAKRAWRYLLHRHGDPAPEEGHAAPSNLRLPPTAQQWRAVPSWEWHKAGVDSKRSATIIEAARRAPALERLAATPSDAELSQKLQSIPGIGPWTVAETVQRTHGCPDSISVLDYHLAAYVGAALTGRRTDDDGMLTLLKPWAGQRQRVVRMLYASGFRKPTFGPKLAPSDHRRR